MNKDSNKIGLAIGVGVSIGVSLSVALDNWGMLGTGIAIGFAIYITNRKKLNKLKIKKLTTNSGRQKPFFLVFHPIQKGVKALANH